MKNQNMQVIQTVLTLLIMFKTVCSDEQDLQQKLLTKGLSQVEYSNLVRTLRQNNGTSFKEYIKSAIEKGQNLWSHDYKDGLVYQALKNDHNQALEFLFDNGLSPDARYGYDFPLIYLAATCKAKKCTQSLITARADLNVIYKSQGFLHYAAHHGLVDVIQAAINQGFDTNKMDYPGVSLAYQAVAREYFSGNTPEKLEVLKLLLANRADVNKTSCGRSLLHAASSPEIAALLVESGVSVDVKDEDGNGALHYLADENNYKTIQLLVRKGADVNLKNKKNQTPLEYYSQKHHAFHPQTETYNALTAATPKVVAPIMTTSGIVSDKVVAPSKIILDKVIAPIAISSGTVSKRDEAASCWSAIRDFLSDEYEIDEPSLLNLIPIWDWIS